MVHNIRVAMEVIAGAEGYEVLSVDIQNVGSLPICNSNGKVIGETGDAKHIQIVIRMKKQREVCDD